jgi:type II secretory pathway component GspD/PulD (secretin)
MSKLVLIATCWMLLATPVLSQGTPPAENRDDRTLQFIETLLQRYDKNNDGKLQRDEWGSATFLRDTDFDGNGVITKDELARRLPAASRGFSGGSSAQGLSRGSSRADTVEAPSPAVARPSPAATSAEVEPPPVEGPVERVMIFVRHAPSSSLADLLNKHFESREKPQVRVVADQVSNALLISASPDLLGDVTKLVEQLDRPPAVIHLEIVVVEQAHREPAAVAGAPSRTTSVQAAEDELRTGPADEVLAKIQQWERDGKLQVLHRLHLSTLENQNALVQMGQRKPVVQGVTLSTRGETRNVMDHNVGLLVACTPRTTSERDVIVQINFEKSDVVAHPDDPPLSISSSGEKIPSTRTVTSTAKSTVTIGRQQAVVLADVSSSGSREQNRLLLVVTAGVSGAAGKSGD